MRILSRTNRPWHHTLLPAAAAALLLWAGTARAAIVDPLGDFLPSFAFTPTGELDVLQANATYNGTSFTLSSVEAGPISTTSNALFVWGFNRGAGTARFPIIAPGVLFDSVVAINPTAGNATVRDLIANVATVLLADAIQISGNSLSVTVPASLLPSLGFAPGDFTVNLWPRTGAGNDNQISDFAPDNTNFAVTRVPEPASTALLLTGLAGLLAVRRRRAPAG